MAPGWSVVQPAQPKPQATPPGWRVVTPAPATDLAPSQQAAAYVVGFVQRKRTIPADLWGKLSDRERTWLSARGAKVEPARPGLVERTRRYLTEPVTVRPGGGLSFTAPRFVDLPIAYTIGEKAAEAVFGGGPTFLPGGAAAETVGRAAQELLRRGRGVVSRVRPRPAPAVEPPTPAAAVTLPTRPAPGPLEAPRRPFVVAPGPVVEETTTKRLGSLGEVKTTRIGRGPQQVTAGGEVTPPSRQLPAPAPTTASGSESTIFARGPYYRRQYTNLRVLRPEPTVPGAAPTTLPPSDAARQVLFPASGHTPQTASQFQAPREVLNRVLGQNLGDKIGLAEEMEAPILGARTVLMRQAGITRMTPAEDLNLLRVLEGRAQPMNPRVATLAQTFRQIATEDAQDYTAKGARVMAEPVIRNPNTGALLRVIQWRPFRPIQNYAPRMLDPRRVVALGPQRLAGDLRRVNPSLSIQDAAHLAQAMTAEARGMSIPAGVPDQIVQLVRRQSFLPGHLHARMNLTLPDSVLRPMKEAIPIYLEQAAKERGFLAAFGANADEQVEQAIRQLGGRNEDVKLAAQAWDLYRGRFIESETAHRQKQTANILNNLASATLLGPQTAIIQPSQFSALIAKFGLRRIARGMATVVFQGGKAEAERMGTFVNTLTDELVRLSPLSPTATWRDRAVQASGRLARGVIRYSGIQTMDQFPRAVGYHAARIALEDARRAAVLGNQRAVQALAEVGLQPTATAEELQRAAAALSRHLNVTANFADLPIVLQTPIGAFARGLNTFNIQVMRMVWKDFITPATEAARRGNWQTALQKAGTLAKFGGTSAIIGEAIGETRRALAGRRGDRPGGTIEEFLNDLAHRRVPGRVLAERVGDEISWSGTLGVLQNLWQSMQFAMSGTEQGARLIGTLTGAGISSAGEMVGGAAEAVRGLVSDDEKERLRRLRTAARIGTRRLPMVGGILGPRLFRSATADRRVAVQQAARALLRGDRAQAGRILGEFERRHGKPVGQEQLDKAVEALQDR